MIRYKQERADRAEDLLAATRDLKDIYDRLSGYRNEVAAVLKRINRIQDDLYLTIATIQTKGIDLQKHPILPRKRARSKG